MTDSLTYPTEAAVINEIARESMRFDNACAPDDTEIRVNVLRDDEHIEVTSHEKYAAAPRRQRGNTTVTDVGSFAALLAMPEHQGSTIFADQEHSTFTAVVNFHGWRDHRVLLELQTSTQFQRWANRNGSLCMQSDFAEMIADCVGDIAEPPAADLLELAQTFQAIKNVDFESGTRQSSGEVKFRYVEHIEATAGTAHDLKVPDTFVLNVPVWAGSAVIALRASLRYRISREGLLLGFRIAQLDDVMTAAFDVVEQDIRKALPGDAHDYTIVHGRAPMTVHPMQ